MLSEAAACAKHTDSMVELRYSLWRVPMALHAMVTAVEEEKVNKVGYHSPTYHTIYDNKQKDGRSCYPFFW